MAYLSHLMSVSALVMESGGSEDEAIAALLHDSIEDRGNSYESAFMIEPRHGREALKRDIELQFGAEVLSIVRQLRVSCADKLHNARAILADYQVEGEKLWQRFNVKSKQEQLWCYEGLADAFTERGLLLGDEGLQRLARQLAARVEAIGRHAPS